MKPKITVSLLPPELKEYELQTLDQNIVAVFVSIDAFGVKNEDDMIVLFPPDSMKKGLGSTIVVEIVDIPNTQRAYRVNLAESVGKLLKDQFSQAYIECVVRGGGRWYDECWSSK